MNFHSKNSSIKNIFSPKYSLSQQPSTGIASILPTMNSTELSKRSMFSFVGRFKMRKLKALADANPKDAEIQANYMKELNKYFPLEVVERYESGNYAIDETATKEYLRAMLVLGRIDQVPLQETLAKMNSGNGSGNGANPPVNPFPSFNIKGPIPVAVIPNPSDRFWNIIKILAWLLGPIVMVAIAYMYLQEDKKPISIPVAGIHSLIKNVNIRFEDVKGVDEAKDELKEIVEYLKNPQKFAKLGAKLPKGVLLCGEPGTGKTLMARAIAGEAGVPFLYCSGASFDELFVGVGPRRVRDLFEEAKRLSPCIIFIDELDAIGQSRKFSMGGSYAKESTLNQLLTELDGFKPTEGIIIIGATNLPETLDSALTRPGRFDKQVVVPVPDYKGRKDILDLYLKKTVPGPDVNSEVLARGTIGFTGAELHNLINLAAIKATIKGMKHVDMKVIEEAKDDILMGIKRTTWSQTEDEKKMTAYHESGHALVALFTEGSNPVHKATIISRGASLGSTVYLPEKDELSHTKKQMFAKLAIAMGGRAAEEIIYGPEGVTTGASSDFRSATLLAQKSLSILITCREWFLNGE
jgi:ATP-dependent metalloprotease